MKKKILALLLTAGMVCGLAACGQAGGTAGSSAGPENLSSSSEKQAKYNVGVCQLVQHQDLDAATEGFEAALKDSLGDDVNVTVQNAQNDSNTCSVIINGYVSNGVDLIMANGTPALQAAASGTDTIPIVGTCVTNYAQALNIDNFNGTVGGNITGTTDQAPMDQQADMVKELFPDKQKIGLLYCSAELNSKSQVDTMNKYLTDMGYKCTVYTFSDSNDLASVATEAANNEQVIYIPTDNTVGANSGIVKNICLSAKVPVVTASETICRGCGVATLCLDAYELGYKTGQMASDILTGKQKVSEMPIEKAPEFTKKYNPEICKALGIKIPDDYQALDAK